MANRATTTTPHIVQVTDLTWQVAQEETGKSRPASRLREDLHAVYTLLAPAEREALRMNRLHLTATPLLNAREAFAQTPPIPVQPRPVTGCHGTLIRLQTATACDICGSALAVRAIAVMWGQGPKHVGCATHLAGMNDAVINWLLLARVDRITLAPSGLCPVTRLTVARGLRGT